MCENKMCVHAKYLLLVFLCIFIPASAIQFFTPPDTTALLADKLTAGELWRLFSAPLTHVNVYHWAINMAGAVLCLRIFQRDISAKHWLLSAGFISSFNGLMLWAYHGSNLHYVGFSSVLHGWVVVGILAMFRQTPKLAAAMLCALIVKLYCENVFAQPSAALLDGVRIATESHFVGALAGFVYIAALTALSRKPAL